MLPQNLVWLNERGPGAVLAFGRASFSEMCGELTPELGCHGRVVWPTWTDHVATFILGPPTANPLEGRHRRRFPPSGAPELVECGGRLPERLELLA